MDGVTERETIQSDRETIRQIAIRLGPVFEKHRVSRAIVFGSLARGESSRRSDFDLVVVQETEKRFLGRYDDLLPEAERWLQTAQEDLRAARTLADAGMYTQACFYAQQSGEKAVKALWYLVDAVPWGHSVGDGYQGR